MPRHHEILDSRLSFEGRLLRVFVDRIRLPGGEEAVRETVRHPGAAGVVALDEDRRLLLVSQNRHAVREDLLEIPAGKLDRPGEDPRECAHRELEEETGYRCSNLEPLISFLASPGFTDERIHHFLATDLARVGPPPDSDEGEPLGAELLGLDDALEAIWDGRIVDSKTIIGILLARLRLAGSGG
ncbi:MAG: NUDIX domain-containing protein, partial [Actinomycetota bacterium]